MSTVADRSLSNMHHIENISAKVAHRGGRTRRLACVMLVHQDIVHFFIGVEVRACLILGFDVVPYCIHINTGHHHEQRPKSRRRILKPNMN